MYRLQLKPDAEVRLDDTVVGAVGLANRVTPVATLKDEYGGVSHIIVDDHCYVLMNNAATVKHWYHEAVEALRTLPPLRNVPLLYENGSTIAAHLAMHWSAPAGLRCSDCQLDREPCPICYEAWWKAKHPNVVRN